MKAFQLVFLFQGPADPREVRRRLGPQVGNDLLDQSAHRPGCRPPGGDKAERAGEARRRGRPLAKEQADKAAASAERALAQAETQAAEKEWLAEAVRRQEPLLMALLNTAPPLPEFEATARGAGGDYPIQEREGGDVAMPDVFVPPPPPPPPPPAKEPRDKQPVAPPVISTVVTDLIPAVRQPAPSAGEGGLSAAATGGWRRKLVGP